MSRKRRQSREQVYRYIVDYKQQHDGLSPRVGDIARACFLHPSTVRYHLLKLELERRIRVTGRRAIEVIGGAWDPPDGEDAPDDARSS